MLPAELFAFGPGAGIDPTDVGRLVGLTTLAIFHWPPRSGLLEAARRSGVRVVRAVSGGSPECDSYMHEPRARAAFVRNLTATIGSAGGINLDIEGYGGPPSDFTALVRELRASLPLRAQLSVDVSAWPDNPHYKRIRYNTGYDYAALVQDDAADFLVVMGYDMHYVQPCSNVEGNCSAPALWNPRANSPLAGLQATVKQFRDFGVAPSKLVMALPFYGVDYTCNNTHPSGSCQIYLPWTGPGKHQGPPAVFPGCKGCPSHIPGGTCPRISYGPCRGCGPTNTTVVELFQSRRNTTAVAYDKHTASNAVEYMVAGRRHQLWYDSAQTLAIKSAWSRAAGLRGAGVYELGMVNLSSQSGVAMWDGVSGAWNRQAALHTKG
eukprot:COSAG01_NODE_3626_length_5856_cov_134.101963_4_plen_379_part_00